MTQAILLLILLLIGPANAQQHRQHRVTQETDLAALCQTLSAGDKIVLANGVWKDAQLDFVALPGSKAAPITLVAETPGKVIFQGETNVRISGQHVAISGITFRDCSGDDNALELRTSDGKAQSFRVTDCIFDQSAQFNSKQEATWLAIYGANHRIDHCYFGGKTNRGATMVVWVDDQPENHRIDHNHFGPRPKLGTNDGETIRIGDSKNSESPCRTVVEDNYFYRCDGEAEIISNKSCGNTYRHNVFHECSGALTLRHGHRCLVEGNLFLGGQRRGTGGVRIIGSGHHVINNYMEGLRGDAHRSAISLMNGILDGPLNGYAPVKDAIVAHNTLIDCKSSLEIGVGFGKKQSVAPEGCVLANNLFASGKWPPLRVHANGVDCVWKGNKQEADRDDDDLLVKFERVQLGLRRGDDKLMRPTDQTGLESEPLTKIKIETDIDGEQRLAKVIAGCDNLATKRRSFPSPRNTGPQWRRDLSENPNTALTQQTFHVDSADAIDSLLESGELAPGDAIVWAAGTYRDVELNLAGVNGTAAKPITLRAENPGATVLCGESQFCVGVEHWVISGFHFTGVEGETNAYNTLQFRGGGNQPARHVRLTNCAFTDLTTEDETSKWILIYGQSNAIDHCHFQGKNSKGAMVTVELGYLGDKEVAGHQIVDNYFGFFSLQDGNDNETIRIGMSKDQNKQGRCLVRGNYFFRCDGENEIISSKSSYNVFQRNTFRKCNGSLVLRHGHHARVEGNWFFGDGADDAGGVRVVDSHHTIVNNYFQNLTGEKWNAALSVLGGKEASGGTSNGYQVVEDLSVVNNTWVNCKRSVLFNKAKGSRAPAGIFANNLISSSNGPLLTDQLAIDKIKWAGNVMHGAEIGPNISAIVADPGLAESGGMWRPSVSGIATGAAVESGVEVKQDIDGQTRPKTGIDIGADEVDGAIGEPVYFPTKASDVGVSFLDTKKDETK